MFSLFKKKDEYSDLVSKNVDLRVKLEEERRMRKEAELNSDTSSSLPIEVDMDNPAPLDENERKAYVGEVAGSYRRVWKDSFRFMLSNIHREMEDESNTKTQDDILKGMAGFCREAMRFGERMINEQVAYEQGESPSTPAENESKEDN